MFEELDNIITTKYNEKPIKTRLENRIFTNQFRVRQIKSSLDYAKTDFKIYSRRQNILIDNLNLQIRKDMKEMGWIDEI